VPDPVHPVLYSVGTNGIDDHASEAALPGQCGDIDAFHRLDRVFYLTPQIRAPLYVPHPPGAMMMGPPPGFQDKAPWDEAGSKSTAQQRNF
jgi:hypothetical protein